MGAEQSEIERNEEEKKAEKGKRQKKKKDRKKEWEKIVANERIATWGMEYKNIDDSSRLRATQPWPVERLKGTEAKQV